MFRLVNVGFIAKFSQLSSRLEQKCVVHLINDVAYNGLSTHHQWDQKCYQRERTPLWMSQPYIINGTRRNLQIEDDDEIERHYPIVSMENYDSLLVQEIGDGAIHRVKELTELEVYISLLISPPKIDLAECKKQLAEVKNQRSLLLLRNLHLRFRLTVRKAIELLLSEKVPRVVESYKGGIGGNFFDKITNKNRDFDYSFFLKQLEKDINNGHIVSSLLHHGINDPVEFFETCKYALEGDRESFLISCPKSIYYIEEEISAEIVFPDPFDKDLILKVIENVSSDTTQLQCRRVVSYLVKLLAMN